MRPRTAAPLTAFLLLTAAPAAPAETYHVAPGGDDAANGLTRASAFATLGRACGAADAGDTVRLAPGDYPLGRTAVLKGGVTLVGADRPWDRNDRDAVRFSTLRPGPGWARADPLADDDPGQYLLRAAKGAAGVTVRHVRFRGVPAGGAESGGAAPVVTGAFHADRADRLTLDRLDVEGFRACGLRLLACRGMTVAGCRLRDAALEQVPHGGGGGRWGGMIWTRWPKDSVVENCRIEGDRSGGYGIKGHGSDGFRVTRCVVTGPYFSLEHPHENEFGLEIDHCRFDGCISVPKGGPQADPATRGHARSVYIHHNLLTDSYTVEGPRQYLEFAYNYVHAERPNGRCYTHHGGEVPGPVLIHHNVFENVDRACVWMNRGFAGGVKFYNNTVFAADAGGRSGVLFDSWSADRLDGWELKNNIFTAAWTRPRTLLPDRPGVRAKVALAANRYRFVTPPADSDAAPFDPAMLTVAGDKPAPFFRPPAGSPLVDVGEDVGLPFAGAAPDVGAFEFVPPGSDDEDPWADWAVPGG